MTPSPILAPSGGDDESQVTHTTNGAKVPIAGDIIGLLVAMISISVLSICLSQRNTVIKRWNNLPAVVWITFAIYIHSFAFVVITIFLQQIFGINSSFPICHGAILLCLICYVTTKFIYLFLVEKAHIIRSNGRKRLQSRLYCFNTFGMLSLYGVVVAVNFIFRIAKIDDNGVCIIGMRRIAMIPLVSFDAVVNIYLTVLFLVPLRSLYSFKNMHKSPANMRLRNVAFRTFIGSCCTLISTIVNLTVSMALNGEPGWVCLICCNSDVLFSALVIQWVTFKDNAGTGSQTGASNNYRNDDTRSPRDPQASGHGHQMNILPPAPPSPQGTDAEMSLIVAATAQSSDDGRNIDMAKRSSTGAGAVVVTTTIHRQSLPMSGFSHDQDNKNMDSVGDLAYGYPPQPMSYGVNSLHDGPEPPRTHITGWKGGQRNGR